MPGCTASIKNVTLHKISVNSPVYMDEQTVTNLTVTNGGTVKLYATWVDVTAPTTNAPTATETKTNKITVKSNQTDSGTGIKSVQYQIKKNGTSTWGALQSSGTFSELTQGTKYDFRTHAIDNAGNASDSSVVTISTGTIGAVGTASISPTSWTNGNVTVTLPTSANLTTRYTTDGSNPTKSSTQYSNSFTVSSNCTIKFVYTDGTNINAPGTVTVSKIDKVNPTTTAPTATITTDTITINNKQTDASSGIKSVQYSIDNGSTWQTSAKFTGLSPNKAYIIRTKATDNAGNTSISGVATATTPKLKAEQVGFTPADSNWKVTNVKEALDYLYSH